MTSGGSEQSGYNWDSNAIAVLYSCLFAFVSGLFLAMLYSSIVSAFPETDLWWMIPILLHYVDGKSFGDVFNFLLSPAPIGFGQPSLKVYLFLLLSLLGLQTKHLISASIVVHFVNSGLLFFLSKNLGLNTRISFFSTLMYLTIFAHLHSYMWPTAAQHILAVFFILLVLNLYLKTNQVIKLNEPYRWYFYATLAVGILASFQRGTIIAPILMLTHILVCSEGGADRIKKYDIWLPFFVTYLVYPLIALTFAGDVILTTFLATIPGPSLVRFLGAFLLGVLGLLVVRVVLLTYPKYKRWMMSPWFVAMILSIALFVILSLKDKRNLLLPYHVLVPFVSLLTTFLEPLQQVFAIDSAEPYHIIPPAVSVFNFLLGLLLIGMFAHAFILKQKQLVLLFVWYVATLMHLLFQYSSHPVRTPSRYYIYLSPVFSIIVCSMLTHVYDLVTKKAPMRGITKEVCLALVFITLFLPNMFAIKIELLRGKLANTYYVYDYIRAAELIKLDVGKNADINSVRSQTIYVSNVVEMPFKQFWEDYPVDPYKYENFRFVMKEVFGNQLRREVKIGDGEKVTVDGSSVYVIRDDQITNGYGDNIDPFSQLFARAVALMRLNREQEAIRIFHEAIERMPFLLSYVLAHHRLEDLRWITNGLPMRVWINKVAGNVIWVDETVNKHRHVLTVMNNELSDYILCFFYMSYLKHRSGKIDESKFWLSQIRHLESDSVALTSWISKVPVVSADREMVAFVQKFDDASYFRDPLPWRKDDYGFARFIFQSIFNRDVIGQVRGLLRTARQHEGGA